MKKVSILITFLLVFSSVLQVSAANIPMPDTEYEAQVADILASYSNDPEAAREALAELDTVLVSEPSIVAYGSNSNGRGTSPSDYELTVSAYKRGNSNRFYLQWLLIANANEWFEGPLDYVSLEWDTAYGSYYLSSAGGEGCTVQGREAGIVLFNVEDNQLGNGDYVFGTVQVEPISGGWLEFGSKFLHTYTSFAVSGSASYSFVPSASISQTGASLGLSYTNSFTVNVSTTTNKWQIWADNAVNIYGS